MVLCGAALSRAIKVLSSAGAGGVDQGDMDALRQLEALLSDRDLSLAIEQLIQAKAGVTKAAALEGRACLDAERSALDHASKVLKHIGVSELMKQRAAREAMEVTKARSIDFDGEPDKDDNLKVRCMHAALARHMIDLKVGLADTKGGRAIAYSFKSSMEGRDGWMTYPRAKEGVDPASAAKEAAAIEVAKRAAELVASGQSVRKAVVAAHRRVSFEWDTSALRGFTPDAIRNRIGSRKEQDSVAKVYWGRLKELKQ